MNVYDFDNTIYDGETIVDFYLFCLKKDRSVIKYLPAVFIFLLRYKLGLLSLKELEKKAAKYVNKIFYDSSFTDSLVKEFWNINEHKIKTFYKFMHKSDDVIISASCNLILDEICERIGVKHCLCSEIDAKTGEILRICYRANKPEIFRQNFPCDEIDRFYTDSKNDLPMIRIAKEAFLVKGNKIYELKKKDG